MSGRMQAFADRRDAGRRLAVALRGHAGRDPLVLALPRGGVPVAYEVAVDLGAPLDLVFVRKIGAPGHPELGLGALVDGADPQLVMNASVERAVPPPPGYVEDQVRRELREIDRRRATYLRGREPVPVHGRSVLLIDDGVATGGTVRAALRGLAKARAGRIVLGVPVGPPDVIASLAREADEMVCLMTPEPFRAVGLWYRNFRQTTDAEVIELLAEAERALAKGTADGAPPRDRARPVR
jgi:putative phosphoribosyl transferase